MLTNESTPRPDVPERVEDLFGHILDVDAETPGTNAAARGKLEDVLAEWVRLFGGEPVQTEAVGGSGIIDWTTAGLAAYKAEGGVDVRTVRRALHALCKRGLLVQIRRGGPGAGPSTCRIRGPD